MSFLLLLWICASGALLARRLDETPSRWSDTLALGTALGLAVFAAFGFILGWTFGLSGSTVLGAAVLTSGVALRFGVRPSVLLEVRPGRLRAGVAILMLLTAALVVRLASRVLLETPTGISTGDRHNLGDLPFHLGIAAGFAWGDNFPPDHPELAGVPLTYPFFSDLVSGMILATGGGFRNAFFWPSLLLGLGVVAALVRFSEAVTGSRALGRTAAGLTFFSGGLGFLTLSNAAILERFWTSGPDLTTNDLGMRYANFITTLLIPQRSILFGWPLLFFALALLIESLRKTSVEDLPARTRAWFRAGVLGSLLPLVHSHSFAVLVACVLFLALWADRKALLAFIQGVVPLALPAILFMASRNSLSTASFFAWQPGFDGGAANPLRFWMMNAGLFLPLAATGVVIAHRTRTSRFAAPFAALFILANLFRLSPWIWDNMKFLAPAHAGFAPFAALALAWIWKQGHAGKAAALLAFVIATLSGALDVLKVAKGGEYGIFEPADLAFAEKVRAATTPETAILTAPAYDHAVLLSGRREFMGYEGHLWSQGLDYAGRKAAAEALFRGEPQPEGPLIRIDALAVTPAELALIPDRRALEGLPSLVDSPYRLLRVR